MNKAFSLIEILVALAIVAIAATGILTVSTQITQEAANTRLKDKMAILAYNKANELIINNTPAPIDLRGRFEDIAEDCSFTAKSSSINRGASFKLDVQVRCEGFSYNLERIVNRASSTARVTEVE